MKKILYTFFAALSLSATYSKAQSCNAISEFPFSESFETTSPTRACWTQNVVTGNQIQDQWLFIKGALNGSITSAHSGELNARMRQYAYTPQSVVKLITPKLDVTNVSTPTLSFFHAQEAWGLSQNELKIYYRLSETSSWILLKHYWSNTASWTKEIIPLPEKSAELQIAFEGIGNFGRTVVLDDVVVAENGGAASSCTPSTPSNQFENGNGDLNNLYVANDFSVSAYVDMTVRKVKLNVIEKGGVDNFDIDFYNSNGFGLPNIKIGSYSGLAASSKTDLHTTDTGYTFQENIIDLPTPMVLHGAASGQKIWIAIKAKGTNPDNNLFWEATSIINSANAAMGSVDGTVWTYHSGNFDGVFSLIGDCAPTDPTSAYCTPSAWYVVPITNVKLADMNHASQSTSTQTYEDYSSFKSNVTRGESYDLEIKSATFSEYKQNFTVFIDWNKNGKLNDDGEIYNAGSLSNSTGDDGQSIRYSLPIPLNAGLGDVRMRIVSEYQDYVTNPCNVFVQGQVEDYTLVIAKEQLSTSETNKKSFTIFPNPTDSKLFINAQKMIRSTELYSISGQKLISGSSKDLDLSGFPKGIYILKITFEDGTFSSEKVIRK